MPVVRTPWQNFPPVLVHTSMVSMKSHPGYLAAKSGDSRSARELVNSFFKPSVLSGTPPVDYVVPVMQLDVGQQWNALPLELARLSARVLHAKILPLIVQDNIVHHTGADSIRRLLDQPSFTGKVLPGRYLIVDDVVTLGATLANLRGWIESNGAHVALAPTLSASLFSTRLVPDWSSITAIKSRCHDLSQSLGLAPELLTNREARFISGLKTLESIGGPRLASQHTLRLALGYQLIWSRLVPQCLAAV